MGNDIHKILTKLDRNALPQDMRGMGFSYKILPTRNNFRGKDLRGCVFYSCFPKLENEDCIQIGAIADISKYNKTLDLQRAYLYRANLWYCNLEGANLQWATLQGADLQWATLQGADLRGADLYGANLQGTDLRRTTLDHANLREADLYGANLREANLDGADLDGADLRKADLREANLEGANLKDAIYDDVSKEYFTEDQLSVMRHISEVDA